MNVDEILGDDPDTLARLERLKAASDEIDHRGMQSYFWAHEFSRAGPLICYDERDPVWSERAQAYRDGFARIPSLDGVVLMFGSADLPPWFSICTCDWCADNYPGVDPFEAPPNDERIRMATERIGGVIVNELDKGLVARTFVHEEAENAWHAEGFAAVSGLDFLGMHKSEVQDWQPYNPPDPTLGQEGEHHSLVEFDVAGEYYGLSILPFCAPEYFAWRLSHARSQRAIGTAIRIERGSHSALGTPNEVNLQALADRLADPHAPVETTWQTFMGQAYGLQTGDPVYGTLQNILADTFAIRLKSHYVLGIWALDKGSDLPSSTVLDQFEDRGQMPKFDPDWQPIWDALNQPDRQVVLWVWQEASEAVELAADALTHLPELEAALPAATYSDLRRRLLHQHHAATAWRATKLFIWADRARAQAADENELIGWMAWAHVELGRIQADMAADGLSEVQLASPGRIQQFLDNTNERIPAGTLATPPPEALFSHMQTSSLTSHSARVTFQLTRPASIEAEWGPEIPDFGSQLDLGEVAAGVSRTIELTGLEPGQRTVLRLRSGSPPEQQLSGYHWIFPPE